jgi:hypothetical protein
MEEDGDTNPFIEGVVDRDQASVEGKLIHAAADLASVFKQQQDEDRAPEFDARTTLSF